MAKRRSRASALTYRIITAFTVTMVAGFITINLWQYLKQLNDERIERTVEIQSLATRAELRRSIRDVTTALHQVRYFWDIFGDLPREMWRTDASIELSHFEGIDLILWHEPDRNTRYARTSEQSVYDYRPPDAEWQSWRPLIERASQMSEDQIIGPEFDDEGHAIYQFYFGPRSANQTGKLVAVVDFTEFLASRLENDSPEYSLTVKEGETLLFERHATADDMNSKWGWSGDLQPFPGHRWRMQHTPTESLAESFVTPAIDIILLFGLIISILLGTLTFEHSRARARARAAELAEAQVNELNRGLEETIRRRTQDLQNRTRDLQTITDSVGHDLRNPLNIISVNAQLLSVYAEADELPEERKAIINRIGPAVERMSSILDRLLGLSSVHHLRFERKAIDMTALVRDLFEMQEAAEPPPPVTLELERLPEARAEETLVRLLVDNLLSNAFKYTRSNQERRIRVDSAERDGVTVYRVHDNGIGFDQRAAKTLFEAFHRLHDARAADGLGLGLMIVARVVERHEGQIWAEGTPGEGATFSFTLEPVEEVGEED